MQSHVLSLATALIVCLLVPACGGGSSFDREQGLSRLRQAIEAPVNSSEESAENSRLVEQILEESVFDDMLRTEVEAKIGRGEPCSRHPRCAQAGFEDDDWFYAVGQMGETSAGAVPVFIVGFDHHGRVVRTWNLTTH